MKAACPATTGRVFSRPAANSTEHRLASRAGDLPGPVAAAAVPACSGRLPGRGARVSTFASSTDAAGIGGSQEGPGDLGRAFELVQEALSKAEANVERVPHLPSARRRREMPRWARGIATLMRYAVLLALLVAAHSFGRTVQIACAVIGGTSIGAWGYGRESLSASGAAAAALVGSATLAASLRAGVTLLAFYFSSSKLTTLMENLKDVDEGFKKGGQRNWIQVMCNAAVPTALALTAAWGTALADMPLGGNATYTQLTAGFLGYFACCCGDTWASEGTNGGVTWLGLLASMCGGLFVGLVFYGAGLISPSLRNVPWKYQAALAQWPIIALGLVGGTIGSLLDSVLGASVQFTGYNRDTQRVTSKYSKDIVPISGIPLLDNNMVNLVSASTTSLIVANIASRLF